MLERKIAAGYAVAVGFLLFLGGAAWWSAARSAETFRWVDHTHAVLSQLESGLTDMLNMQSATRGFLLTGKESFLGPFAAGSARIEGSMQRLRNLTRDNPAQQAQLTRLEESMSRSIGIMLGRIALRRREEFDAASGLAALEAGKRSIDEVRAIITGMEGTERRLLAERSAEAQSGQRRAVVVFGLGTLLAMGLVISAGLVVRRDFYQRVKAEAERDRFFNLSLDLLVIASAENGRFLRASPAVTDLLGWTVEEFLARPYMEQIHPDDRAAAQREVERQVVEGRKVLYFEARFRHKDGSWRVLAWRSVPQPGGLMYGIARDVTAQKAAEAALRASEAEYRTLFESIDEGYCIIEMLFDDQDRPADYRFLSINPAFEKQTGLVGALGRRMRELAPDHEANWFEIYGRIALTGEPERFENFAAQRQRWFDVYAFRYGDPANRQVAIICNNITERKQRAVQLEAANHRLQEANAELEAFSYSVSHDLRAPLRHIDGFAGLLRKNSAAALDAQGRRHLETISGAARQMGRLIDDLLGFSRMSRAQVQPAEVDQDALVAAVIRERGPGDPARPVGWLVAPLPRVQADPAMLRQVWVNLLDNAVKYSGKVSAPRIEIGHRRDAATCEQVFFVRDNGAGFDMRYGDKLFGVFQRLHGPAEFEGTGIGLANVRRIVTRHGGRTWAEGRVGEGATFYFSLPDQSAPA
jgi:PAS domain S-box-containing protein